MSAPARLATAQSSEPGLVSLVGAGPGDLELLTLRALSRLRDADVVFHDGLVPEAIVGLATAATRISVARRAGHKSLTQADVIRRLIHAARMGHRVVRLKGGDPFVFGRGGEELTALAAAGVPVEVVPGVTSATAAPALAGIPVTHRGVASGLLVVSGHSATSFGLLERLAGAPVTVAVLMGLGTRRQLSSFLIAAGWASDTPAAIVVSASRPDQTVWTGTLQELDGWAGAPDAPGVIVLGEVASFAGRQPRVARPTRHAVATENPVLATG